MNKWARDPNTRKNIQKLPNKRIKFQNDAKSQLISGPKPSCHII